MRHPLPRPAAALAALLVASLLALAACAPVETAEARVVTLEVGGMTCAACVEAIRTELSATPGVATVAADPEAARFTVTCDDAVADTALTAAVRRAGPQYLGMVVAP